jgi:4-amino-4-deoxy-L-arabinose transferase-like glycosyltransferase
MSVVIFLWALGGNDLWAPDEPFFAEGAREMLVDGHWAVPHVNGKLNNHKQALFFWLIALASMPVGVVTPWTARLPSVLAALGTVLLTIRIGRHYYGQRTAAMAAVILSTTYLFWDKARSAQIDATLCFFIWVALAAFAKWYTGELDGRWAGPLFWAATAFAVLAKGPVGLLIVIGIVVVFLASDRRRLRRLREFAPISGPMVFALIVGTWMIIATVGSHGEYSVWGALKEHVIDRSVHGMAHRQPPWYYAKMLPVLLFPWSALAIAAVILAWRKRGQSIDRFLLVAATVVIVIFSISTEKRGLYVLPAMPAFALLVARLLATVQGWIESGQESTGMRRWVAVAQGATGALLAVVGIATPFAAGRFDEVPRHVAILLGVALALTGAVVLVMSVRRAARSALPLAAGMAVSYLLAVSLLYPALEPRKSARPFALKLKEVTAASRAKGHEIVAYGMGNVPAALAFYSDGVYTEETDSGQVLEEHILQDAEVFAVINADGLNVIGDKARQRVEVLHQTRLSRRDVLLIRNRKDSNDSSQPVTVAR